ncbi:MAG: hypothetical protein A3C43_05185 [Candidatus Schekmanbacteria bacterium RIFCSPHIGHO2_02_FULL_38_11]|uniref:Yip1 domain-containing protein n=1 Tax=Candidatus Schekmanbacteria bacterium RIFCSPLOWO2_12_FULL_38_15 TaxID=1817883 RepID=A0A1F7SE17_9BACT|nr:MAG: hypothetical protein A2043_03350 [Candidatus Schekmanbacteria bacterium GWA2_38_9]OGL51437.1 MAG: hypothetical protein A3G31_06180 [Candidatus Schekmanbacteria bacterium RIFCSPLOWO2_12_FULL_38_15]OGL51556.1 MAG: hypothetical protein A3H37_09385 [Candidatus Schekmanbacteria bacterium RIFCSPLOWO2_02_FULL_38_14]OGL53181.1 MAG: hypothetical protein A3C43_05185 [Candidatus Schekmanbacteria bacterium RIFCSPHIGHO2_02_FULL_38_11]
MVRDTTNTDMVYYIIASPKEGVEAVREKNFFFLSLFIAALSLTSSFIGSSIGVSSEIFTASLAAGIFVRFFLLYLFLFPISLLYNFIAEIFGRKEKVTRVLTLLGFSFVPWIFKTPLSLICNGFNLESLYAFSGLILVFWIIGLQVFLIKRIYEFSLFRTLAVYLFPLLFMILMTLLFALIILIFLAFNTVRIFI